MRKTLKDFYYGNLTPGDQDMAVGSELKRAVDRITRCEQHLTERLGEPEQLLLNELTEIRDPFGGWYSGFQPAGRTQAQGSHIVSHPARDPRSPQCAGVGPVRNRTQRRNAVRRWCEGANLL